MKPLLRISFLLFLTFELFAQSPQQINLQAVLRDDHGSPVKNQAVTITASFTTFNVGTLRYRETHAVSTDDFGLIHLTLGTGNPVSGSFQNIQWDQEQIAFSAEAAIAGGVTINIQEQKFVSVPYALHANTASSLTGPNDTDITNELNQSLVLSGTTLRLDDAGGQLTVDLASTNQVAAEVPYTPAAGIAATNVQAAIDELVEDIAVVNTDEQTLSLSGNMLSIQNGNDVDLTALEDDADANPENEIQHLSIEGSTISLSGSDAQVNITALGAEADDQTAAQVPFDGTPAQMDADDVQAALVELAAEKVRNLQEAYSANSLITLNGTNELQVNTNAGAPLLATSNTGRIGIGTTAPNATLDVSSSGPDASANIEISNSDNSHRLFFFPGRTSDPNPFISVQPGDPLRFASYDGLAFTEHMRVGATGNIGIGTNTPAHKMHVVGQTTPLTGMDDIESFAGSIETGVVFDFTKAGSEARTAGVVGRSVGGDENFGILGITDSPDAEINRGVFGISTGGDSNMGVTGNAIGAANYNTGLYGFAKNAVQNYGVAGIALDPAFFNIGVYGVASGGTNNYAGYFNGKVAIGGTLRIGDSNRNVGIGTTGTMESVTNNTDNVGIGTSALNDLATGNNNVAIGRYPMTNATGGSDNVAIGHDVLTTNTTGSNNIALGYLMLRSNTTGSSNIVMGDFAMDNNVSGSYNIALGRSSGGSIGAQNDNVLIGRYTDIQNNAERGVAIGYNSKVGQSDAVILGDAGNGNVSVGIGTQTPSAKLHVANGDVLFGGNLNVVGNLSLNGVGLALYNRGNSNYAVGNSNSLSQLTSGNGSVAFGTNNLNALTTGNSNVAIGSGNMTNSQTAFSNIAIGVGCLPNSQGNGNIALGSGALNNSTAGAANIALGTNSLNQNTTGNFNISLGSSTLNANSSGLHNIAMGWSAMFQNTTGDNNVALGQIALNNNTTGDSNVGLGFGAGVSITGSHNVAIGASSNIFAGVERAVAIGYNSKTSQNDAIILGDPDNASVHIGIGLQNPSEALHVDGNVLVTGIVTASNIDAPSDRRLKTNITPINDAINTLAKLEGVSYFWKKDDPDSATKQFGLIAQELEKVLPELVRTNAEGFKSVNYISLIPFFLEAIKGQQRELIRQQEEITRLQQENGTLKASMDAKFETLTAMIKALEASLSVQGQHTSSTNDKK